MTNLPNEVLLAEGILTQDRLDKPEQWLELIALRKEIFDRARDSFGTSRAQIMEVIYKINVVLRACTNSDLDDMAPVDMQECKDKLHHVIHGESPLNMIGKLNKVSDLRAIFFGIQKR